MGEVTGLTGRMTTVCGDEGKLLLGISPEGELFTRPKAGAWAAVDFNRLYAGHYPFCRFSAVGWCGGVYYAAGTGTEGETCLYRSLLCGVWEPVSLLMLSPLGVSRRAMGPCVAILYHDASGQVFLVCQSGQLITLPDCPRCVSIRSISRQPLATAFTEGDEIVAVTTAAEQIRLPVAGMLQHRISRHYATGLLQNGAVLADLRTAAAHRADGLPGSVSLPFESLAEGLAAYPTHTPLVFYCENGSQADEAVRWARRQGYARVYSMGGVQAFTYLE